MKHFILIAGFAVLMVLVVIGTVAEQQEWEKFKRLHQCHISGKMDGDVNFGMSTSGNMVTTVTPDKTGWTCNDGITYWK